jgi:hypothetical protein
MADFRNSITPGQSIGLSNNNPLNLKWSGSYWKGQVGQDQYGHAIFSDTLYGIRAASLQIMTDINVHGYNTLNTLVSNWTSNGVNYAQSVANAMGISPDDTLVLDDNNLPVMLLAMSQNEIGTNYALMIDPNDWTNALGTFNITAVNAAQSFGGYGYIIWILATVVAAALIKDSK